MNKKVNTGIVVIIILIVILNVYLFSMNRNYKKSLVLEHAKFVQVLNAKYPEITDEIIKELLVSSNDGSIGMDILKKYGLDSADINFYQGIDNNKMIIPIIVVIEVVVLLIVGILLLIIRNDNNKKIKRLNSDLLMINSGTGDIGIVDDEFNEVRHNLIKLTRSLKAESQNNLGIRKDLEQFLSEISHQIKTPLTSLYLMNELMSGKISVYKRDEFLNESLKQLDKIEWLVSNLLKVSLLENGSIAFKSEKVNSVNLINKCLEEIKPIIDNKNINIVLNIEDFNILLDFNWTKEAIVNVLKNATEHTKDEIVISFLENPVYSILTIKDNGKGINKKYINNLFERFFKGDKEDSFGIGLNMSKNIINKQNGDISVINDSGAKFIIRFYK